MQSRNHNYITRAFAVNLGTKVLFILLIIQQSGAFLDCFTPNMLKVTKGGLAGWGNVAAPQYSAAPSWTMIRNERPNLYPSPTLQPSIYPVQRPYGYAYPSMMSPLKPGFGYGMSPGFPYRPGMIIDGLPIYGSSGALTEQLNVPPFSYPSTTTAPSKYPQQKPTEYSSMYTWPIPSGWTLPSFPFGTGGQYQSTQPSTDLSSPYGPTNGKTSSKQPPAYSSFAPITTNPTTTTTRSSFNPNIRTTTTTRNSLLLASGGYDFYDSSLSSYPKLQNHSLYGYTYPEGYFGPEENSSKVAQQLVKFGIKRQQALRFAPSRELISSSSYPKAYATSGKLTSSSNAQFMLLDEPRFVGFGSVDVLDNKEARLSCSFNEAIDETNISTDKLVPPFNCADNQCRVQDIESIKDYRYKFDNGPATSTLIITDPRLSDYGAYRCSALTKSINKSPIETVYQVIHFRNV